MTGERYLNVRQAAERLMVTEENLRRMIRSGRLPGESVAGSLTEYRVREADLQRMIDDGSYVPGLTQPGE